MPIITDRTIGCNRLDLTIYKKERTALHSSNLDPNSGMLMPEPKICSDEELANMIDAILKMDDHNRNGIIDYPEFIQAQEAATTQAKN
ncbi:unnamed protein product [Darwinula stevensoni]|uniref:EF-hand domain-containing protein n=1 Tax=Darwinula stevensoni TaxID=69355 RepID=A0A7R8XFS8_9CRUS|nr:unnamed protein product [Darwinula stevensoni]CAG0890843.1 unnamed protein product [Darwinula stevensoni]